MGTIGNCCCTCYIPDNYELPTITKTGWTASSWSGLCCKCMTLSPNDPYNLQWQNCCSSPFLTQTRTIDEIRRYIKKPTVKPKVGLPTDLLPCSFTVEQVHCCPDPESTLFDLSSTLIQENKYKLLSGIKLAYIEICISKQEVTCGDASPVTKWIVSSKYFFNYVARIIRDRTVTLTREITGLTDPCVSINDDPAPTLSCSDEETGTCDLNDLTGPGILCVLSSGLASFNRVKFYDTLPTGTVTFTDSDLGSDCVWDSCGSNDARETSLCFSVSSVPACNVEIDLCDCNVSTSKSLTPTTVNIDNLCCQRECIPITVPGSPDYPYTIFIRCCDGDVLDSFCEPSECYSFDCGTQTVYAGEAIGNLDECETKIDYWLNVSCALGPGQFYQLYFIKTCDENSDCYWDEWAATTCTLFGCGTIKFYVYEVFLSRDVEKACTFVSRQCCFNSPSWSVTFA